MEDQPSTSAAPPHDDAPPLPAASEVHRTRFVWGFFLIGVVGIGGLVLFLAWRGITGDWPL